MKRRCWRLLPYHLYVSTVLSAFLPPAAIWVYDLLDVEPDWGVVRVLLVAAAAHQFLVAAMIISDWRQSIRQLRALNLIQCRKRPWTRLLCRAFLYGDSSTWWRTSVPLAFVPGGATYLVLAFVTL